ncbi:hypothetical protein [Microvirga sp. KLBC 81]|uniref:hypothetical protein n=1 Tax=Microvirga sp. KLBC 81 TaxID=1862707 RepID=UPI0014030683|nr:hypothetical protein [Microvirga sp. KLBC 81]
MAEAARLRQALEQAQERIRHQILELAWIEAELDPLLLHPPEELATVRALPAQDPPEEVGRQTAHA